MLSSGKRSRSESPSPASGTYSSETVAQDFEYVATKLGLSVAELEVLMRGENKTYRDYKSRMPMIELGTHALRLMGVQKAIIR